MTEGHTMENFGGFSSDSLCLTDLNPCWDFLPQDFSKQDMKSPFLCNNCEILDDNRNSDSWKDTLLISDLEGAP